jgi:hypothetical protein
MPITRTPMIDDDGSGTTGTIINNAWKQELYNQIDATVGGVWQNVPYAAGNFTGSGGMTWTVDAGAQALNRYALMGKTLFWAVYIAGGQVGGTASNSLYITIPGGYSAGIYRGGNATAQLYDGIHQAGFVSVESAGTKLRIQKITEANFSLGLSYIRFSTILEIN